MITTKQEEVLFNHFTKKYSKLHLEKACFSIGSIPNYILLDSTRNIHSYFEFCSLVNGRVHSVHIGDSDNNGLLGLLRTQYSQLDRPLFFIINIKGSLYSIESEIIREHLLEGRDRDVSNFIIENADRFQDVITFITQEL